MDRREYEMAQGVNFSTLKWMARSPAHYRHALMHPRKDTDAMKRGRAVHLAVLEPEEFGKRTAVWAGGRRAGKEWQTFVQENPGKELLTEDEYSECLVISDAVRNHPVAAQYLSGGKAEQSLFWKDALTQIPCKGRADFISDRGLIVDLKTCRDGSPDGFGRSSWNLGAHIQGAWYVDGMKAATGKDMPFVLVSVETEAPYVVSVYRVNEDILSLGRETYRSWLQTLMVCRSTSKWPGYVDGESDLSLPRWAAPRDDEDLTGLDLQFA